MTALSAALQAAALFLFTVAMVSLAAMVKGCFVLRRLARIGRANDAIILMKSPLVPAVSAIAAPMLPFPEARDYVRRLIDFQFGNHEVVVVLEHSEPELIEWIREFHLSRSARVADGVLPTKAAIRGIYESRDPFRLAVVDKEGGGPGDALNLATNMAAAPIVALADEESEFDSTMLLNLIRPMLADPDRTIAVCGMMPPPRESAGWAGTVGALQSLRSWLARCAAFAGWNMLVPVPGSSMLVRRDAIVSAGGFRRDALELFLDLHAMARKSRSSWRFAFVPESVSRTRTPRSWADLVRRDSEEQAQIASAAGRPGQAGLGAIGWGLPALCVIRWLCPLLETAALLGAGIGLVMGWVTAPLAGVVLLATAGAGILVSMAAVVLRELASYEGHDPAGLTELFLASIPENLGYRQLRNLWLIAGFFPRSQK